MLRESGNGSPAPQVELETTRTPVGRSAAKLEIGGAKKDG